MATLIFCFGGSGNQIRAKHQCGKVKANLPEAEKGQARDFAAKAFDISPRTVEHASRVIKTGIPELVDAVESGCRIPKARSVDPRDQAETTTPGET